MKKSYLVLIGVLVLIILLAIFWLNKKSQSALSPTISNSKIKVVTSFYPLYFFTSIIGGDKVTVSNITPASAEPHDYDPTSQDIAGIEKSQLLILNGGKLESWGDKIKSNLSGTNVVIITAGDNLTTQTVSEGGIDIIDPHVWLDPTLAKTEVENITQGLIKVDPTDQTYFENNQKVLGQQLDLLDQNYKLGLSHCQLTDFVTSHAAFGYLAKRYNLNQVNISGLSPDEEPSPQKLVEVTNLVKQKNIKYIFFEKLISPKLSETIASETGAKTLVLDPIEGISNDDSTMGKNYLTVMQDNLTNLKVALQCQ